jgi:Uma2 family endonuclease
MAIPLEIDTAIAAPKRMTLEEYLRYDDGMEVRYELVDGVLIEMGAESTINTLIAGFVYGVFLQIGLPTYRIGFKQKISVRGRYATAREPDMIIHTDESFAAIEGLPEACLQLDAPNPLLVIEVVSPGSESSENYQRDYIQKPVDYAVRGIPEYWIVDADRAWVKVGRLVDGAYEFRTFVGEEPISSKVFPDLSLAANQVLRAGR